MKKLLLCIFLVLMWCNVVYADSPYTFFGVEFGSNISQLNNKLKYKLKDRVGDKYYYWSNTYEFEPINRNNMFQNYYFSTTALTNTVKSIEAIGDNFYTRRIDCTETMEILRDKVLEVKRKKFPEKKYIFKSREITINNKIETTYYYIDIYEIIGSEEIKTTFYFTCRGENKGLFYNPKFYIFSEKLNNLNDIEWRVYKKKKIDTKGFE